MPVLVIRNETPCAIHGSSESTVTVTVSDLQVQLGGGTHWQAGRLARLQRLGWPGSGTSPGRLAVFTGTPVLTSPIPSPARRRRGPGGHPPAARGRVRAPFSRRPGTVTPRRPPTFRANLASCHRVHLQCQWRPGYHCVTPTAARRTVRTDSELELELR